MNGHGCGCGRCSLIDSPKKQHEEEKGNDHQRAAKQIADDRWLVRLEFRVAPTFLVYLRTTFVFFLVAENRYANEMREPWQLKRNLQTMKTRDFVKTGRPYRDTHGS